MSKNIILFFLSFFIVLPAFAETGPAAQICPVDNKSCLMKQVEQIASSIEKQSWKDQTYRELAKTYTYNGQEKDAVELIGKVISPDTRAMTIRGIGFAAADSQWRQDRYAALFAILTTEADKIEHEGAHGIALTYIAMAQAFAGDDDGATKTAKSMINADLRNKAFGETAEIQAERGDLKAALQSISYIESVAFRNKSYRLISKIFEKQARLDDAYQAALMIENNNYMQAQAIQRILNHDNPEEAIKE